MSILRSLLYAVSFSTLLVSVADAHSWSYSSSCSSSDSWSRVPLEIVFTVSDEPVLVYEDQFFVVGEYITHLGNNFVADTGTFVALARSLSPNNEYCDSLSFDNSAYISLYGENGVALLYFRGKTAFGENNFLRFIEGEGIYEGLGSSRDADVLINCEALPPNFTINAYVRTDSHD